jgi:hypothetical protein
MVIRSQADWLALWRQHKGPAAGPPPSVHFDRTMVIAVFGGTVRRSIALAISRITREPDRLVVWYMVADTRPLPQPDQGMTATPFHIVRLARSALPVTFLPVKTPPVQRTSP